MHDPFIRRCDWLLFSRENIVGAEVALSGPTVFGDINSQLPLRLTKFAKNRLVRVVNTFIYKFIGSKRGLNKSSSLAKVKIRCFYCILFVVCCGFWRRFVLALLANEGPASNMCRRQYVRFAVAYTVWFYVSRNPGMLETCAGYTILFHECLGVHWVPFGPPRPTTFPRNPLYSVNASRSFKVSNPSHYAANANAVLSLDVFKWLLGIFHTVAKGRRIN